MNRNDGPKPPDQPPSGAQILPEDEIPTETLAETQNYVVWASQEDDGEMMYHIELGHGNVTIHFFQEEWDEFIKLMKETLRNRS